MKSTAIRSAADIEEVGWPELAAAAARTESTRSCWASSCSCSRLGGLLGGDLGEDMGGRLYLRAGPTRRLPQPSYPIATMRSIGSRARSAISAGTLTSNFISRRASRSFGSVIIFMYLQ